MELQEIKTICKHCGLEIKLHPSGGTWIHVSGKWRHCGWAKDPYGPVGDKVADPDTAAKIVYNNKLEKAKKKAALLQQLAELDPLCIVSQEISVQCTESLIESDNRPARKMRL